MVKRFVRDVKRSEMNGTFSQTTCLSHGKRVSVAVNLEKRNKKIKSNPVQDVGLNEFPEILSKILNAAEN